jgi:hypothetical protein
MLDRIIKSAKQLHGETNIENQETIYYELDNEFHSIKSMEEQFLIAINILFKNHKDFLKRFLDSGTKLYERTHYLRIMFTERENKTILIFICRSIDNFLDKTLKGRVKRGRNQYICIEVCWQNAYFLWLHEKFLNYYLEKGEIQNHNVFELDHEDFGKE